MTHDNLKEENKMRDYPEEYDNEKLDNQYFAEAFPDAEGPASLYRQIYKYTACGPGMGATVTYIKVIESDGYGSDYPSEKEVTETIYCDELRKLGTWKQMDDQGVLLISLSVSSIVEGVDQCTDTHEVEAKQLDEEPEDFAKRFYAAVDAVDKEADAIWHETHGCETCAEHWGINFDDNVGQIWVWTECPDCGGSGIAI